VTSYANLSVYNDEYRTWQASDGGSELDMPNLASITNGLIYDSRLAISALAGGTIVLNGLTQIVDPNSGDQRRRMIGVTADGGGSMIRLPALASFVDNYSGNNYDSDPRSSLLTATNGGAIQAGALTTLQGVQVTLDGTGTLAAANLAAATLGEFDVSTASVSF